MENRHCTREIFWEFCSNISQEFRRDGKSLNPGRFSSLSVQDFGKGHARFTSPFLPPTEIQFPVSHSPQAGAGELNWSLHGDAQIRCAREGQRHIHCCGFRWCKSFSLAPSAAAAGMKNYPAPTRHSQKTTSTTGTTLLWMWSEFLSTLQDSDPLWWLHMGAPWKPCIPGKPSKAEFNIPPHASIFSH